jgi:hypothetical protein
MILLSNDISLVGAIHEAVAARVGTVNQDYVADSGVSLDRGSSV